MPRMPTIYANADGWTDWQLPKRHYRMGCCDCGLVHDIEFRVVVVERQRDGTYREVKVNPAKSRVQFRVHRNNRSTGQVRRHQEKP